MKKTVAAVVAMLVVPLFAWLLLSPRSTKVESSKAAAAQEQKSKGQDKVINTAGLRDEIVQLAAQRTPDSREKLIEMYVALAGNADQAETRRAIIRQIIQQEDPAMAIQMIVTAVSRDPIPLKSDETLKSVAREMTPLWKDSDIMAKGMDLFRMVDNPKGQALLAESLSARILYPPAGMGDLDGQRYALVSDLAETYRQQPEGSELRPRLLQHIEDVGGSEMAELTVNPMNPNARYYQKMEHEAEQARNSVPPPPPTP